MTDFERKIEITPAFDKRHSDPAKDYGIHGCDLRFVLIGPLGAVQFLLYTGWHLPHVKAEFDRKPCEVKSWGKHCFGAAQPADIGYHSPRPMYSDQPVVNENCEYLGGIPCYYDGSSLQAEDVFKILVEGGGEAMWKELERRYHGIFDAEEVER